MCLTCVLHIITHAGVDERMVKKIVGHKGQGVTQTVYTHFEIEASIPVTIYLPPQFIQHFFYCFFNPFICILEIARTPCPESKGLFSRTLLITYPLRVAPSSSHSRIP